MTPKKDPFVDGLNQLLSFLPPAEELSDEENAKVAEIRGIVDSIEKRQSTRQASSTEADTTLVPYVTFNIREDNTLEITGSNRKEDSLTINSEYDGRKVTHIAPSAFRNSKFKKIELPDTLTHIGGAAFEGGWIQSIVIPASVTCIARGAFSHSSLRSVVFAGNFCAFGEDVFRECVSLTDANMPSELIEIPRAMFMRCYKLTSIELPRNIKVIHTHAFSWCRSLKSIEIPDSVEVIEDRAFMFCDQLQEINGMKNVSQIGEEAFFSTPWLEKNASEFVVVGTTLLRYRGQNSKVTVPENVTHIGYRAFSYCVSSNRLFYDYDYRGNSNITHIVVPSKVEEIGEEAFADCVNLTKIEFNNPNIQICAKAFANCPIVKEDHKGFQMLNDMLVCYHGSSPKIRIPSQVRRILPLAFGSYQNAKFKQVILNEGVCQLDARSFHHCYIDKLIVSDTVAHIDPDAFSNESIFGSGVGHVFCTKNSPMVAIAERLDFPITIVSQFRLRRMLKKI